MWKNRLVAKWKRKTENIYGEQGYRLGEVKQLKKNRKEWKKMWKAVPKHRYFNLTRKGRKDGD